MIRATAAYANLTLVPPVSKGAAARKAAARSEASAEARLKAKVDQANRVLDALEARQARFAANVKEWSRRKAAVADRIERLEDAILTAMQEAGLAQVAGARTSLCARPAPEALAVDDPSKIPAHFFRSPKTPPAEPDKTAIKKAIAETPDLDPAAWGCRLTQKVSLVRK